MIRAVLGFPEFPGSVRILQYMHQRQADERQHAQKLILLQIKTGLHLHCGSVSLQISIRTRIGTTFKMYKHYFPVIT